MAIWLVLFLDASGMGGGNSVYARRESTGVFCVGFACSTMEKTDLSQVFVL